MSDAAIEQTSPPELAHLPAHFWGDTVREPVPKRSISLRVDEDILVWMKQNSVRYQTKINDILRAYKDFVEAEALGHVDLLRAIEDSVEAIETAATAPSSKRSRRRSA